jgi:hypothetical protein
MYTTDAKPTQTHQVFSEAPTVTLALPGWVSLPDSLSYAFELPEFRTQNLRHSMARVLSFYRTSTVVSSRHATAYDFEKGVIDSDLADFGISDHWQHATFNLSSMGGRQGEELVKPALPIEKGKKPQNVKRRASYWVRSQLWFNTYRCVILSRHW